MAIVGAGPAGTSLAAMLGMDAEKIRAFHDDPGKVATDRGGMRSSIYAKRITIETSWNGATTPRASS